MNEVRFSIEINAPKEKVWSTLWQDETFRQWASIIDPGTYMKGELKEGSKVQFISSENGYGVTSLVAQLKPNEYLLLKHQADTKDVGEGSREAQWSGGEESYLLEQEGKITTLTITFGVPAELEEYFQENYPKALGKVKELAEKIR